jgi:hypothetical protein
MKSKSSFLLFFLLIAPFAYSAQSGHDLITREIPWDGSESMVLDVPANVRFVQAPGRGSVVVTGPRRSVATFSATGGVLRDRTLRTGASLEVVITAPKVTHFSAKGGDRLTIENFDQQELHIETTGRAEIKAGGIAGKVRLDLQGAGWADLGQVKADGVEVNLTGRRNAIIAPSAWARLSGNGGVVLLTQPAELTTNFGDSGRVIIARPATLASLPSP